jgi:hypothetical protein
VEKYRIGSLMFFLNTSSGGKRIRIVKPHFFYFLDPPDAIVSDDSTNATRLLRLAAQGGVEPLEGTHEAVGSAGYAREGVRVLGIALQPRLGFLAGSERIEPKAALGSPT